MKTDHRTRPRTQFFSAVAVREFQEVVMVSPPRWLKPKIEAAATRPMQAALVQALLRLGDKPLA